MSRRIAIAFSLALTVVVTLAVASLASQAGWLQAQSDLEEETAVVEEAPRPAAPRELDPIVITKYVYEDVPVVVPASQAPFTATAVPQPTAVPQASEPVSVTTFSTDNRQDSGRSVAPSTSSHSGDWDDDDDEDEDREDEEREDDDEHEEHDEHEDDD
jgi:hypothetical protein